MKKHEVKNYLFCRNNPFTGSYIFEFPPYMQMSYFKLLAGSSNEKYAIWLWLWPNCETRMCAEYFSLCCDKSVRGGLWLGVQLSPQVPGKPVELCLAVAVFSVAMGLTIWPSVTKRIKTWAWHFRKLLSENKLTTLCQTSQQALEIT